MHMFHILYWLQERRFRSMLLVYGLCNNIKDLSHIPSQYLHIHSIFQMAVYSLSSFFGWVVVFRVWSHQKVTLYYSHVPCSIWLGNVHRHSIAMMEASRWTDEPSRKERRTLARPIEWLSTCLQMVAISGHGHIYIHKGSKTHSWMLYVSFLCLYNCIFINAIDHICWVFKKADDTHLQCQFRT